MDEEPIYNHAHRAFLQALLSRSVMTVDELKPVLAAVLTAHNPARPRLEGDITPQLISTTLQTINTALAPLDYEIRSTRDQRTKTLTYALVNTASDSLTQLATTFTPDEIAFVKRLLDAMFDENNNRVREVMAVSSMRAVQLARAPRRNRASQANGDGAEDSSSAGGDTNVKGISQTEADAVLLQLVAQGFFHRSKRGYYSLAPRALMELRAYLKETYNDPPADENDDEDEDDTGPPVVRIRDCEGCREIVTVGYRCSNRDCGVRWHDSCAMQFFNSQQRGAKRCPKCKAGWTGRDYVGERADRVQGRDNMGERSSGLNDTDVDEEE